MATWGSCDFQQLLKLQENFNRITQDEWDAFCRSCIKELAARLLSLVIRATPVGKYPKSSGKKGGTLRRGWTAKSGSKSGKSMSPQAYANSLTVEKTGSVYKIEIINPVEYASYVEFGHRTVNNGWVSGQFFLTISEAKLQEITPALLEKKLQKLFSEVFNV